MAAEAREFDGLLARADRVEKLDWPLPFARRALLGKSEIVMVANGPGPGLAGRAADIVKERQEDVEALASVGYCGALDPALGPCDIFVASGVLSGDSFLSTTPQFLKSFAGPASNETCRSGVLLSVDRVVHTAEEKARLRSTGAGAVEMEAAAVATRAGEWKIPFFCVKVVTDTAQESFPLDFNRLRDSQGRFSRARILMAALKKPVPTFSRLMKLDRRCRSASRTLGDFLANARF